MTITIRNASVLNTRPQNASVKPGSPNDFKVTNSKSNNSSVAGVTVAYLETKTTRKGEPMGLLLSLTYPTTVTFQAVRA